MSLLNVTVKKAKYTGEQAAQFNTYVTLKLQNVKSTTVTVKGSEPHWGQDFLFEINNFSNGLLVEIWTKGMIWDRALGYRYIPLHTVPYSTEETTGQWYALDTELIFMDGEVAGTKIATTHMILLDCRFEIPYDPDHQSGVDLQRKLELLNGMISYERRQRQSQYLGNSGYSEDSDYTSDLNYPVSGQNANSSASQYRNLRTPQHSLETSRENSYEKNDNYYEQNSENHLDFESDPLFYNSRPMNCDKKHSNTYQSTYQTDRKRSLERQDTMYDEYEIDQNSYNDDNYYGQIIDDNNSYFGANSDPEDRQWDSGGINESAVETVNGGTLPCSNSSNETFTTVYSKVLPKLLIQHSNSVNDEYYNNDECVSLICRGTSLPATPVSHKKFGTHRVLPQPIVNSINLNNKLPNTPLTSSLPPATSRILPKIGRGKRKMPDIATCCWNRSYNEDYNYAYESMDSLKDSIPLSIVASATVTSSGNHYRCNTKSNISLRKGAVLPIVPPPTSLSIDTLNKILQNNGSNDYYHNDLQNNDLKDSSYWDSGVSHRKVKKLPIPIKSKLPSIPNKLHQKNNYNNLSNSYSVNNLLLNNSSNYIDNYSISLTSPNNIDGTKQNYKPVGWLDKPTNQTPSSMLVLLNSSNSEYFVENEDDYSIQDDDQESNMYGEYNNYGSENYDTNLSQKPFNEVSHISTLKTLDLNNVHLPQPPSEIVPGTQHHQLNQILPITPTIQTGTVIPYSSSSTSTLQYSTNNISSPGNRYNNFYLNVNNQSVLITTGQTTTTTSTQPKSNMVDYSHYHDDNNDFNNCSENDYIATGDIKNNVDINDKLYNNNYSYDGFMSNYKTTLRNETEDFSCLNFTQHKYDNKGYAHITTIAAAQTCSNIVTSSTSSLSYKTIVAPSIPITSTKDAFNTNCKIILNCDKNDNSNSEFNNLSDSKMVISVTSADGIMQSGFSTHYTGNIYDQTKAMHSFDTSVDTSATTTAISQTKSVLGKQISLTKQTTQYYDDDAEEELTDDNLNEQYSQKQHLKHQLGEDELMLGDIEEEEDVISMYNEDNNQLVFNCNSKDSQLINNNSNNKMQTLTQQQNYYGNYNRGHYNDDDYFNEEDEYKYLEKENHVNEEDSNKILNGTNTTRGKLLVTNCSISTNLLVQQLSTTTTPYLNKQDSILEEDEEELEEENEDVEIENDEDDEVINNYYQNHQVDNKIFDTPQIVHPSSLTSLIASSSISSAVTTNIITSSTMIPLLPLLPITTAITTINSGKDSTLSTIPITSTTIITSISNGINNNNGMMDINKKKLQRGETEEIVSSSATTGSLITNRKTEITAKQRWHWAYNKIIIQLNVFANCCCWGLLQTFLLNPTSPKPLTAEVYI